MANLGIVGHGIVGQAVEYGFKKGNKLFIYDKYQPETTPLAHVARNSEIIFLCLPTPMLGDGSGIDLTIMEDSLASIIPLTNGTDKIVVIKSTVIPGTTARFIKQYPNTKFAFNPEFLTEANYLEDFVSADRTVIGTLDNSVSLRLISLYKSQFPKIPIAATDPTSAEMVKYFCNTFLATKVIFANEMYDLCQKLGIKYEEVKRLAIMDHRIYNSHLDVTTLRGFGGKCFPKDTVAILGLFRKLGVDASLLETIWKKNLDIRSTRDWEHIPFAVSDPSKQL
jgi:nucleotide sugar dehydrogenase